LPQLYQTVTISAEVYAVVVVRGAGLAGASQISEARWINVKPVQEPRPLLFAQQRFGLGIGEVSVIILGRELRADLLRSTT